MGALIHPSGLLGVSPVPNVSDANDANCCAALRVILACFCETLYFDSNSSTEQGRHVPEANQWLRWARTSIGPLARPLFAALVNVALGEQSATYSAGSWLPYGHLMTASAGRDMYVAISLHVLLLLLDSSEQGGSDRKDNAFWLELEALEDYPAAESRAPPAAAAAGGEQAAAAAAEEEEEPDEEDIAAAAALRPPGNFAKILSGFEALLGQPAVASKSVLPASVLPIRCTDELLVLLWHMMCANQGFRQYVSARSQRVIVTVCQHIMSARHDASRLGLLHVCVFILLHLSGERILGVGMNRPIDPAGPVPPPELGLIAGVSTGADLLVCTLYKLLSDSDPQAQHALSDMGLTIICNLSPYTKAFGTRTHLRIALDVHARLKRYLSSHKGLPL